MADLTKINMLLEKKNMGGVSIEPEGKYTPEQLKEYGTITQGRTPTVAEKLGIIQARDKVRDVIQQGGEKMGLDITFPKDEPETPPTSVKQAVSKAIIESVTDLVPDVMGTVKDPTLNPVDKIVEITGHPVKKWFGLEDPLKTIKGIKEGNVEDIANVAIGVTLIPGMPVGKILKAPFKVMGKGSELLSNNPVTKKASEIVDKGWGYAVNYLTTPENTTFKGMIPIKKAGQFLREKLQPAVERLTPEVQQTIRTGKAQAHILTNEGENLGKMLADPSFSLMDKEEFFRGMRGTNLNQLNPKVRNLIQGYKNRLSSYQLDPQMVKDFESKVSQFYTGLIKNPVNTLGNKPLQNVMQSIEGSIPDDKWFRQGHIRKAIGDAITNPAVSDEEARHLIEMFQLPATTPEIVRKSARFAQNKYLERSLLGMPNTPLSPAPLPGYVEATWRGFKNKGLFMPKDLDLELKSYDLIQRYSQGVFSTYFTSPWKTMKIIMSPAAQIRNVFTNFILNDIGGLPVYRMDIYSQAVKGMLKNDSSWKDFVRITGGGGTFQYNELNQLASAWKYKTDWYEVPNKIIEGASKYPKEFYNANEQVFKYAKYLHNLEKGMGKAEAATDAIIPTFNYSEITPTVAYARTHLVPFATWTTKVIPYTFEMAVKHPIRVGKWFAMYQGLQNYAIEQAGMTPEEFEEYKKQWPEHLRNGAYMLLPWRDSKDRLNMVDLTYLVPGYGDMKEMVRQGLWEAVLQHPAITIPADLIRNKKWSGEQIWYDWQDPMTKTSKVAGHLWETVMPSWFGPWGTDYKRYVKALSDQPGAQTIKQAIAAQFGAKIQPLDDQKIFSMRDGMLRRYQAEITAQMNKEIESTYDSPVPFGKTREEQIEKIYEKYASIRQRLIEKEYGLEEE